MIVEEFMNRPNPDIQDSDANLLVRMGNDKEEGEGDLATITRKKFKDPQDIGCFYIMMITRQWSL